MNYIEEYYNQINEDARLESTKITITASANSSEGR